MSGHREAAERLVAAATPKFNNFRVDFEKISNAACKAAREGRDGLDPEQAAIFFHDIDWDLRLPLQRRYAEAGAWDEIAKYHAIRFKNYLGRDTPWPDAPALATLDLFATGDCAELGVGLVRGYVDMQHKRLKRDYSKRNPRPPRDNLVGAEHAIQAIGKAIAGAIPDRKRDLLRDMDLAAPYLETHSSDEDRAWLDRVRRELWMEKRA